MDIEKGWVFYSADFSVNATKGDASDGRITLIRIPADVAQWHKITDTIEDSDDYPELYVNGYGYSIEDAVTNANLKAAHLPERT